MQSIYVLMIILCILSVLLNFLLSSNYVGNQKLVSKTLITVEVTISSLIVFEILLRLFLQGFHNCCSLGNLADFVITSLCILGLIISIQKGVLEELGNATCDALIVIRNIVFLMRLFVVFKHQEETKVNTLEVSLNGAEEEELVTRNEWKVNDKYRPTMDTLFEEEDEEGSASGDDAWKGKRIS